MSVRAAAASRLALLLPVTSRGSSSSLRVVEGLTRLAASLQPAGHGASSAPPLVLLGIDHDDEPLLLRQQECESVFRHAGVDAETLVFSAHDLSAASAADDAPLCRLWGILASAAVERGCDLAVLLGDDTEVQPRGWTASVLAAFQAQPELMVLLLNDAADPGFPSFPVLRVRSHLALFGGQLLPGVFVNQGGDPFLAELYRRWCGGVGMLRDVTVINRIGGVQRVDQKAFTAPRYARRSVSKGAALLELQRGTDVLAAAARGATAAEPAGSQRGADPTAAAAPVGDEDEPAVSVAGSGSDSSMLGPRLLAVDVLVPTARLDLQMLAGIEAAVLAAPSPAGADLQLVLVVDQPPAAASPQQHSWLVALQQRWLHRVRVRFNPANLGASAARNRALQESLAEYVIFFDDDITPDPDCLAAYVRAFREHPQARGFAGPSLISRDSTTLWSLSVHMADVLYFWDAAADWRVADVLPWAVTANVAFANTTALFHDTRFPKTGGGEDIDFCLQAAGGALVPVPQAVVRHPLWNSGRRCYGRFFGWAVGDGALLAMHPQLCYRSAPNSAEACGALLLLAVLAGAAAALATALAAPADAWRTAGMVCCWVCLASAAAYKAADVLLDIARAFLPERRIKHPCSSGWMRAAAATEASLIKSLSEAGRLWGLARRRELPRQLCVRFDWFCGLSPEVVAGEKRWAALRFGVCAACAAAAGLAVLAAAAA